MEDKENYKILRFYFNDGYPNEVILRGLTLAAAQAWCQDPETNSRTATSPEALALTNERGHWFDGYEEE